MDLGACAEFAVEESDFVKGFAESIPDKRTSKEVFASWKNWADVTEVTTANLGVYRLVKGRPVFNLLGLSGNPFVDSNSHDSIYHGLTHDPYYRLPWHMSAQVKDAIDSGESVNISYSQMPSYKSGPLSSGYLPVTFRNTPAEKKLIAGVYGSSNPGKHLRIYLLTPEVVVKQLEKKPGEMIARGCFLGHDRNFNAVDWYTFSPVYRDLE